MKLKINCVARLLLMILAVFSFFTLGRAAGEKIGVLVVAHGSDEIRWNQVVQQGVAAVRLPYPIAVGYLEFTEPDIQKAVTKLESQGVSRIIAVPLFVSTYSNHIEEIKYILRLRDTLPQSEGATGETLRQVQCHSQISLTAALDDHPIVAKILAERLQRISSDPGHEVAVLVGHGADTEAGATKWQAQFDSLAQQVKKNLKLKAAYYGFAAMGKPTVRQTVTAAGSEGEVLLIPVMLSEGFFTDQKIPRDLEGLRYRYPQPGERALLPHADLARFIEMRVKETVNQQK
jgi:sirohydrochlorin ferrochelatase